MSLNEIQNYYKYMKYKQKYLLLRHSQMGVGIKDLTAHTNMRGAGIKDSTARILVRGAGIEDLAAHINMRGGKKLTYSLCVDYDDTFNEILRRVLNKHNFTEIPFDELRDNPDKTKKELVDFLFLRYTKSPIVKEYQLIKSRIKNELSGTDELFNKCILHKLINDSGDRKLQSHIPKTCDLKDVKHLKEGQILILRPCAPWAAAGKGIVRVTNDKQLQEEKHKYEQNKKFSIIASEYIRNPLLFDDRKFHLRMYMIFVATPKFQYNLAKIGKILTAKKPYVNKYFDDLEIHDTHVHSTKHDYFFPKDFNETNIPGINEHISDIWEQMNYICGKLSNFVKSKIKPYEESKSGYHVFGLDFMIDASYHVFLIECNHRPGYANIDVDDPEKYIEFIEQHFEWIYDRALKPVFDK